MSGELRTLYVRFSPTTSPGNLLTGYPYVVPNVLLHKTISAWRVHRYWQLGTRPATVNNHPAAFAISGLPGIQSVSLDQPNNVNDYDIVVLSPFTYSNSSPTTNESWVYADHQVMPNMITISCRDITTGPLAASPNAPPLGADLMLEIQFLFDVE